MGRSGFLDPDLVGRGSGQGGVWGEMRVDVIAERLADEGDVAAGRDERGVQGSPEIVGAEPDRAGGVFGDEKMSGVKCPELGHGAVDLFGRYHVLEAVVEARLREKGRRGGGGRGGVGERREGDAVGSWQGWKGGGAHGGALGGKGALEYQGSGKEQDKDSVGDGERPKGRGALGEQEKTGEGEGGGVDEEVAGVGAAEGGRQEKKAEQDEHLDGAEGMTAEDGRGEGGGADQHQDEERDLLWARKQGEVEAAAAHGRGCLKEAEAMEGKEQKEGAGEDSNQPGEGERGAGAEGREREKEERGADEGDGLFGGDKKEEGFGEKDFCDEADAGDGGGEARCDEDG